MQVEDGARPRCNVERSIKDGLRLRDDEDRALFFCFDLSTSFVLLIPYSITLLPTTLNNPNYLTMAMNNVMLAQLMKDMQVCFIKRKKRNKECRADTTPTMTRVRYGLLLLLLLLFLS